MNTVIRVLMVEDSEDDARLNLRAIRKEGVSVETLRVDTRDALAKALATQTWDVVLSDYAMPQFDGMAALVLVKETGLNLPFVIVSGAIGEEKAVELMKAGAHDCVRKDSLVRLFPAIQRALKDEDMRRQREADKEALEQSESRLKTILDSIQCGIVIIDAATHRIVDTNPSARQIIGCEKDDIIGAVCHPFLCVPEDGKCPITDLGETVNNRESVIVKETGDDVAILKTACAIQIDGKEHILESIVDLTERRRLEAELNQAHKMEAIGTLAGGIAHDFNNMLGIIIGNAELAMDDIPEWHPGRENIDQIKAAGMRARDMVRQLLRFSRKTGHEKIPVKISRIVRESLTLLRASIPAIINIRSHIENDGCVIKADPTQIHQVLMNLCTNAAQAMGGKAGELDIGLTDVFLDEKSPRPPEMKPGQYVQLTVRDTGCGIPPAIMERIFDPYFTTKAVGKGTGMGLAVVHGIVKSHDGDIAVHSQPGKGTTFTVLFPAIEDKSVEIPSSPETLPTGRESILFVDDEEMLTDLARRILEKFGYSVNGHTDPLKALTCFRENPSNFDLVITDLTMPGMTGDQLARELISIDPNIPIIMNTGHSESMDREKAMTIGIKDFIMKPIVKSEMARIVRKVLDEAKETTQT